MVKGRLKEPTYYDSRNIIYMANYVAFLADSFRAATEKGYSQLCRKRPTRTIQMMTKGDYISCNDALTAMDEIGSIVKESKTKSTIASSELHRAAHILRSLGLSNDPRVINLMVLENDK